MKYKLNSIDIDSPRKMTKLRSAEKFRPKSDTGRHLSVLNSPELSIKFIEMLLN